MRLVVVMSVENTCTELMTCYSKRASDFVLRRKNRYWFTFFFWSVSFYLLKSQELSVCGCLENARKFPDRNGTVLFLQNR